MSRAYLENKEHRTEDLFETPALRKAEEAGKYTHGPN